MTNHYMRLLRRSITDAQTDSMTRMHIASFERLFTHLITYFQYQIYHNPTTV